MIVNIEEKNENPIVNRTEIKFSVKEAQKTPSRNEIKQKIIALTNSDEKLTVIDILETRYGTSDLTGTAKIYKDKIQMKKMEPTYILARNFGKTEETKEKEEKKEAEAQEKKDEIEAKKEEATAKEEKKEAEAKKEEIKEEKKE